MYLKSRPVEPEFFPFFAKCSAVEPEGMVLAGTLPQGIAIDLDDIIGEVERTAFLDLTACRCAQAGKLLLCHSTQQADLLSHLLCRAEYKPVYAIPHLPFIERVGDL